MLQSGQQSHENAVVVQQLQLGMLQAWYMVGCRFAAADEVLPVICNAGPLRSTVGSSAGTATAGRR